MIKKKTDKDKKASKIKKWKEKNNSNKKEIIYTLKNDNI